MAGRYELGMRFENWRRTSKVNRFHVPSLPVTPIELATALGLVVIGAVIQGSIGFGLAAVVAPVLLLVNPIFLPGPMLFASMLLTSLVGYRDRRHIHWPEVAVGTAGRVIGMLPAVFAIRFMSQNAYDLLFSVAVLAGVIISLAGWHFKLTLGNLFRAAIGSGFVSAVSAIGGPPLALVYQHAEAPKIRGTLSAIFTIGTPITLVGLWWAGRFGWAEFTVGLLLMPAILAGFLLSRYAAGRFNERHTRPAILGLSAATALVVMVRALIALW
jgi:uncharacterized membrane protein YfcA